MKKIFVILLIFVLVGCQSTPSNTDPRSVDYYKGTEGLSLEFVKGLPPNEVYRNNDFTVGLQLKNKGAFPIKNGEIRISDRPNKEYVVVDPVSILFDLEGKNPGFPEGEYKILNFRVKNIDFPAGADKYPFTLGLRAYYDYETLASASVCINPDLYNLNKNLAGCDVKSVSLSGGQGGPLAVVKVEPQISGFGSTLSLNYKIFVENKAKGEVFKKIVEVDEVFLGDQLIQCPKSFLVEENKGNFVCQHSIQDPRAAYTSPLRIKLSYVYTQKIDKKVTIKALTSN